MQPITENVYAHCPTFETKQFFFRMVRLEDAQNLLDCYSDPASAPIFNSDNCTSNFIYHTLDEMKACVQFWLDDYARQAYIRLSIIDRNSMKAVGTIEFFARPGEHEGFGRVGMLRLDLASRFETQEQITEILRLIEDHFYALFKVNSIMTKSVPIAAERIRALESAGYRALPDKTIIPYGNYYAQVKLQG